MKFQGGKHIVSVSDLGSFSECPRQWRLQTFWQPQKPSPHFWIGRVVHAGLAGYYKTHRNYEKGLEALQREAETSLADLEKTFKFIWPEISPEFDEFYGNAVAYYTNYCVFDYDEPLDGEPVLVEEKFTIPLGEWGIVGVIDLVLKRSDGYWLVDHKTASSDFSSGGVDLDEQMTAYAWILLQKKGIMPRGIVYNVILKDLPRPPEVLKSGKLSVNKSQKTVEALFRDSLAQLEQDPAEYEEYLKYLHEKGWKGFFSRHYSTRNNAELEAFAKRARLKAMYIIGAYEDPSLAYANPSSFRCGYCSFASVCKAMDDGGDPQAILDARFMPW